MESQGQINGSWAEALIGGLAAAGVARAVISPGSRSTPLALACLRHPSLSCRVLLDERTAAFFALGLARAEGRPVALICTSGSAVANWHPAVVEADLARLPLILLTADRPPELQDCGANQTIDQRGIFTAQLRACHLLPPAEVESDWLVHLAARAVSQSLWPLSGPVQINVPFREPLLAPSSQSAEWGKSGPRVVLPELLPPVAEIARLADLCGDARGVIVAGAEPLPAEPIVRLAAALDWPILADPLSGLRFGTHDLSRVMAAADTFLRGGALAAEWVFRFGAFPVSKPIATWLKASEARQVLISPDSRWADPQRAAEIVFHADPGAFAEALTGVVRRPAPRGWQTLVRTSETSALRLAARHQPPEAGALRSVLDFLPEDGLLFVGNSMAIRDLDSFSGTVAKRLSVLGNRGASGIDGNLASFFGAAASGRYGAAVAVVGDLTFLHDLGGLAAGQGINAVICVLDNGGGAIFEHLPQAGLAEFEAGWLTPQKADFAAAARVWGHAYHRVDADRFDAALAEALDAQGVTILHFPIDRAASVARHRALWAGAQSL
ncbi:2-succinyl-5-enolpyruvyl-6-hydroxy-3-cyclohexene-1-carboxylic-acid synthase [Telmatospirillum siberiense]|uniref:2-succinyl-5-enolpyruvyl-6-hydroxy-3-cyclohexene-1-carboxylate synthase n=1 Tax=Telmatospirillum siberiense TaxID=382514 RepID=A0A2N3PMH6_9PROT|nr:2-succinyl-5-enolpyruvyl-6-hydroxy-3-cyclohexene-1-carboxylic-acid synthase [Telmatospirillum siberiense]PKU21592.1 2-succinyl-5-enolpyruvyl-6-hydroxy-3-cyclohexene-1-carboxylic-acid synthase [Telmatospirillum siberiense]